METLHAALLGVVQGLTEFLPVSSTAHLILARACLGWNGERFGLTFDVACHLGTLAAVVLYFRSDIAAMIRSVPRLGTWRGPEPDRAARLTVLIAAGTVPAVAAGLAFGRAIEQGLRTPAVAALMLAAVALVLLAVERWGSQRRGGESVGLGDAVLIGCAQAAALVPGVSRSGATISAGMALGLRRDEAARFGFLLGVPAILAAAGKEGLPLLRHGLPPGDGPIFAAGIASSAVVGYLTVRLLLGYLSRHSLAVFAWYRLALSASVVVWWITR